MIQPAHLIIPGKDSVEVSDVIARVQLPFSLKNNKVYFVCRGTVYEQLKKDFTSDGLDRQFSLSNSKLVKALSKQKQRLS